VALLLELSSFGGNSLQNGSRYAIGSLSCLSGCDASVLWPNGWMDQDATWYGGKPRARPHYMLHGGGFLPKWQSPQFLAHVFCGQTARWIKMSIGTEVAFGPGHIVLDGDSAPRPWKGHSSPHDGAVIIGKPLDTWAAGALPRTPLGNDSAPHQRPSSWWEGGSLRAPFPRTSPRFGTGCIPW